MKSIIDIELPTNFELRIELSGTGTLDFRTFRVNVTERLFELFIVHAGETYSIRSSHANVLHIRYVDSKLYIGDGVTWQDSMYTGEIIVDRSVSVEGLEVIGMVAIEMDDTYDVPFTLPTGPVRVGAAWDIYSPLFDSEGCVFTDFETSAEGLQVSGEGTCHVMPLDLRADFCLSFTLKGVTYTGETHIVTQDDVSLTLSEGSVTLKMLGKECVVGTDEADSLFVVVDRKGGTLHLHVNGLSGSIDVDGGLPLASTSVWFSSGNLTCVASLLAFAPRSALSGRKPLQEPITVRHEGAMFTHTGDVTKKWLRNTDPYEFRRKCDGFLAFGFRVLLEGNFSILRNILRIEDGVLYCGSKRLVECRVGVDIRASIQFSPERIITIDGESAVFDYALVEGDWKSSTVEVFCFAGFPYGVTHYPPLEQEPLHWRIDDSNRLVYQRPGYPSKVSNYSEVNPEGSWPRIFQGGMWVSFYSAETGSSSNLHPNIECLNNEHVTTGRGSFPNTAVTIRRTLLFFDHAPWIERYGRYVLLENRSLRRGILGREGICAYSPKLGHFKLYGIDGGWYKGDSGRTTTELDIQAFGLMALGAGLRVDAEAINPSFSITSPDYNGSHHFHFGSTLQIYKQVSLEASKFLQDTCYYKTTNVLEDVGGTGAVESTSNYDLIALIPGSMCALLSELGLPCSEEVDNVGWIKLETPYSTIYVATQNIPHVGSNLPEQKHLVVDGRSLLFRHLVSSPTLDEWRDIMFSLNGGDDSRGVLYRLDGDHIGLTVDGVPQVTLLEDKAFLGRDVELSLEELAELNPPAVGWRPVLEDVHRIDLLREAKLGSVHTSVVFTDINSGAIKGTPYELLWTNRSQGIEFTLNDYLVGLGNQHNGFREISFRTQNVGGNFAETTGAFMSFMTFTMSNGDLFRFDYQGGRTARLECVYVESGTGNKTILFGDIPTFSQPILRLRFDEDEGISLHGITSSLTKYAKLPTASVNITKISLHGHPYTGNTGLRISDIVLSKT